MLDMVDCWIWLLTNVPLLRRCSLWIGRLMVRRKSGEGEYLCGRRGWWWSTQSIFHLRFCRLVCLTGGFGSFILPTGTRSGLALWRYEQLYRAGLEGPKYFFYCTTHEKI